jgi:N-acylneuraminate cytidylyltransferase
MKICIIPARGGSKRILRKNIKEFNGKPIIAYSIETALQSGCFDRVIVSTDDKEIADIARQYGAEIPFIRPSYISNDYADTTSVIAHAITWLQEQNKKPDLVCCIYATAPFIQVEDLQSSLRQIELKDVDYCFSVTSYPFPIQRSIKITAENRCEMFQIDMFNKRTQDLEEAYHDAGQFYWGKASAWIENKPVFSVRSIPYILPRYQVQDIDTQEDWIRAEAMYIALQKLNVL